MKEENRKKSPLQVIGSSFVIVAGLFTLASMTDSITGNVIGTSRTIPVLQIIIAIWGIITIAAGIWMIRKKDFHKSIFD